MEYQDNETYWIERHESLRGSLASVGKIGTPEEENRQRYARKKRKVVDLLRSLGRLDLAGAQVLDAGCGVGMISELFYALGADVSGVDASPIAVAEACDRSKPPPHRGGSFKVGSLLDFSFSTKFDLTFCLDVLYHIIDDANWKEAVRNLASVTKPNGYLIIIDHLKVSPERPAPHAHFRTKAMYDTILNELGALECTPQGHGEFLVYSAGDFRWHS